MKALAINILLLFLVISSFGQVSFENVTDLARLEHAYLSPIVMGGGLAFFDYNNDNLDDIWINGGSFPEGVFLNKGDGTFIDISSETNPFGKIGLGSTSVITGDVNNDGFRDILITTGTNGSNILLVNDGFGNFENISESAGLVQDTSWTTTAAFGDINLDGYLDIYFGNYIKESRVINETGQVVGFDHDCFEDYIYINNGDLTFRKVNSDFWSNQEGCVLASCFTDFDLDGDQDLMIANDFGEWIVPNRLFQNNYPQESITEVADQNGANPAVYGMGIAIGDYDLDEDLDYYITNLGRNVLLNNQNNEFIDLSTEAGVEDTQFNNLNTVGWGTSFQDINLDMYPDLLVSNGHIEAAEFIASNPNNPNRFFLNNQDGTFEDRTIDSGFFDGNIGRGMACSDYDNDGDIDVLIMNINGLVPKDQLKNIRLYNTRLDGNKNWLKVSLEGSFSNRDAYGSIVRLYVDGKTLMRELSGGSSHASQNSSVLHFGLNDNIAVDSLTVTWPGGESQTVVNPNINTTLEITEDLSIYTSTKATQIIDFKLYPNPSSDIIKIETESIILSFKLYNSMGQLVQSGKGNLIVVEDLIAGMYHLNIKTKQGQGQKKVLIKD